MTEDAGLTPTQLRMRILALASETPTAPTVEERVEDLAMRVDELAAKIATPATPVAVAPT